MAISDFNPRADRIIAGLVLLAQNKPNDSVTVHNLTPAQLYAMMANGDTNDWYEVSVRWSKNANTYNAAHSRRKINPFGDGPAVQNWWCDSGKYQSYNGYPHMCQAGRIRPIWLNDTGSANSYGNGPNDRADIEDSMAYAIVQTTAEIAAAKIQQFDPGTGSTKPISEILKVLGISTAPKSIVGSGLEYKGPSDGPGPSGGGGGQRGGFVPDYRPVDLQNLATALVSLGFGTSEANQLATAYLNALGLDWATSVVSTFAKYCTYPDRDRCMQMVRNGSTCLNQVWAYGALQPPGVLFDAAVQAAMQPAANGNLCQTLEAGLIPPVQNPTQEVPPVESGSAGPVLVAVGLTIAGGLLWLASASRSKRKAAAL